MSLSTHKGNRGSAGSPAVNGLVEGAVVPPTLSSEPLPSSQQGLEASSRVVSFSRNSSCRRPWLRVPLQRAAQGPTGKRAELRPKTQVLKGPCTSPPPVPTLPAGCGCARDEDADIPCITRKQDAGKGPAPTDGPSPPYAAAAHPLPKDAGCLAYSPSLTPEPVQLVLGTRIPPVPWASSSLAFVPGGPFTLSGLRP